MGIRSFHCPDELWVAVEQAALRCGQPLELWLQETLRKAVTEAFEADLEQVDEAVERASESG